MGKHTLKVQFLHAEFDHFEFSAINCNENGKIIIKVSINQNEYNFLLDTGATTAISENLYDLIKTNKLGSVKIKDQSGITDSLEVVSIPEIIINEIKLLKEV